MLAIGVYLFSDILMDWLEPNTLIKLLVNTILFIGFLFAMGKWERPPVVNK